MNPYETYIAYLAMKAHFTQKGYDYKKYNGKIRGNLKTFERRNDTYVFHRLSKMGDVETRLLANFLNNPKVWIGDIVSESGHRCYVEYLKRQQSLTKCFNEDIEKLDPIFDDNFVVKDGQWPKLVRLYKSKEISIDTLVIIDEITEASVYWDKKIEDRIIWPIIYQQLKKYKSFVKIDEKKFKKILREKFSLYK